jgi:hypothetical protein
VSLCQDKRHNDIWSQCHDFFILTNEILIEPNGKFKDQLVAWHSITQNDQTLSFREIIYSFHCHATKSETTFKHGTVDCASVHAWQVTNERLIGPLSVLFLRMQLCGKAQLSLNKWAHSSDQPISHDDVDKNYLPATSASDRDNKPAPACRQF